METIWGINVEARNVVYDYRMIFYIRGKKKKKLYPSEYLAYQETPPIPMLRPTPFTKPRKS